MIHMGQKVMSSKIKVAVYGSLKKGYGNHEWCLSKATFLGEAETLPQYSLFSLGSYPGVIKGGKTAVSLELYDVTEEELHGLDLLEGHPSYYKREVIDTSEGEAWIYLLPQEEYNEYEVIENGVW